MAGYILWTYVAALLLMKSATFGNQIDGHMARYNNVRPTGGSLMMPTYTTSGDLQASRGRIRCVLDCADRILCGSVVYEAGTRQCTLLAEYHSELSLVSDSTSEYFSKDPCAGFSLYSKSDWGALPPEGTPGALDIPVSFVVLHSGGVKREFLWPDDCGDLNNCFEAMRSIQSYDMFTRSSGWADIGVNFFMDASGRLYEGRGWTRNSAYFSETSTAGQSTYGKHVAITIFGDYHTQTPSLQSRVSLRAFCACAVKNGYITQNYVVLGHVEDRPASTYCPGPAMLDMLHLWPLL